MMGVDSGVLLHRAEPQAQDCTSHNPGGALDTPSSSSCPKHPL